MVTIRSLYVKAFEGASADYSYATGFVVDAERGLIMTNRHVVELGPAKHEAVFTKSKEEVELSGVWRDPIHDIGIMRFDPATVKRSELVELPLNPAGAVPGVDVRVTGNDAGEKLSVLSGTIARVDRGAPEYEAYGYNDWNTFYVSAASNTSGGSSGSPVLNQRGEVIALNAGGATEAASSYYLPIFRAQRALAMLQRGVDVTRGEILAELHHEPFDEAARLGLRPATVAALRAASEEETGLLKVRRVVKRGPAAGAIKPGDLLVRVNGRILTHFLPLEEAYDSAWTVRAAAGNTLARILGDTEAVWGAEDSEQTVAAPADILRDQAASAPGHAAAANDATSSSSSDSGVGPAPFVTPPVVLDAAPATFPAPDAPLRLGDAAPLSEPFLPPTLLAELLAAAAALGFEAPADGERREPLLQDVEWCARRQFVGSVPPSPALLAGLEALRDALKEAAKASAGADIAARIRLSLGLEPGQPIADAFPASLDLELERGGTPLYVRCCAMDLHRTLPDTFLEMSGAVMHPLTLHQRLNYEVPLGSGIAVASAGYMLGNGYVPGNAVITSVETRPTPQLRDLEDALCSIADRERFSVRYFVLGENKRQVVQVLEMDRRFHRAARWQADRREGLWHPTPCRAAPPAPAPAVQRTTLSHPGVDLQQRVFNSLVVCEFSMPFLTDAVVTGSYFGSGLVVDAASGLVVVDRNTVPAAIGDARITIAGSVELPATVRYLHPYHNFGAVSYDASLLETDRPMRPLPLARRPAEAGEVLMFVGTTVDGEMVAHECVVTKVQRTNFGDASPPRFRAYNGEAVHVDRLADCMGGVLVRPLPAGSSDGEAAADGPTDETAGEVVALLASFSSYEDSKRSNVETLIGLPVGEMHAPLESLAEGKSPFLASLDAELHLTPLSMARQGLGLPQEWCERIERLSLRRQVVAVTRCMPGVDGAAGALQEGDLLLAINGEPVMSFLDVDDAVMQACEAAAAAASAGEGVNGDRDDAAVVDAAAAGALIIPRVEVTILRDREVSTLSVRPRRLPNLETTRIVSWAGALLQDTPRATLIRGFCPAGAGRPGVYVSRWAYGSVAHKFALRATKWITEVNGTPVGSLDEFLAAVRDIKHGDSVRLRVVNLHERETSITLKTDLRYCPTAELRRSATAPGGWDLRVVEPTSAASVVAPAASAPKLA